MRTPDSVKAQRLSAREKIKSALLVRPLKRFTLAELATIGGCSEAAASARWREIARDWEGLQQEVSPGTFLYWLTGRWARPVVKKSARDLEVAELRARIERLEASLPYVLPVEVEG